MNGVQPPPIDAQDLERAILQLAGGKPELVIVDGRVLKLLLGGLERLIILDTFDGACRRIAPDFVAALEGEEPYVWEELPDCE